MEGRNGKKRNVVITFFFHMSVLNFSLEHQFLFISYILYTSSLWKVWTRGEVKPSNEIFSPPPSPARASGCVLPAAGEIKFRAVMKSLLHVPLAGTHIVRASGCAHTWARERQRERECKNRIAAQGHPGFCLRWTESSASIWGGSCALSPPPPHPFLSSPPLPSPGLPHQPTASGTLASLDQNRSSTLTPTRP